MKFLDFFKIIVAYILIIIIAMLLSAFLYMSYSMCAILITGHRFSTFNLAFFIQGLYAVLPAGVAVCPLFVAFYLIRHKEISGIPVVCYMVLHFALWFFLLPFVAKSFPHSYMINKPTPEEAFLSPGYFRTSSDGKYIFYYSQINNDGSAEGVCIDTERRSNNVMTFSGVIPGKTESVFSDPLIKNSIEMPFFLREILHYFGLFTAGAYEKCSGSLIGWLFFSSIIIAIMSVLQLRSVSSWRLVCVLLIFAYFIIVFGVNTLVILSDFSLFEKISSPVQGISGKEAFLAVVNIIFFVLSFIVAAVSHAVEIKSTLFEREDEE